MTPQNEARSPSATRFVLDVGDLSDEEVEQLADALLGWRDEAVSKTDPSSPGDL
jgi:hypothetical protein